VGIIFRCDDISANSATSEMPTTLPSCASLSRRHSDRCTTSKTRSYWRCETRHSLSHTVSILSPQRQRQVGAFHVWLRRQTVKVLPFVDASAVNPSLTALRSAEARLTMFDETELTTLGMLTATVEHPLSVKRKHSNTINQFKNCLKRELQPETHS